MGMCARAVWRRDLDTAKTICGAHAAADKLFFIDGVDVKLCNPVLFASEFTASKIQALAEPKPEPLKGKKKSRKVDGYSARLRKVEL